MNGEPNNEERLIERVRFEPERWDPPGPVKVIAGLTDGVEISLFTYYSDETRFSAEELIGLSVSATRRLHHERDASFLRG
jgi:hypothetical protein